MTSDETSSKTVPAGPRWALRGMWVALVLVVLGAAAFALTDYALTQIVDGVPRYVPLIFSGVVIASVCLSVVVFGNLAEVFQGSRAGLRGARLHKRFVTLLMIVGALPAILAFSLTGTVLKAFSDEYFVERVTEANLVARDLANGYFTAEARKLAPELLQLATDLVLQEQNGLSPQSQPVGFRKYLLGQAILRNFTALTILDQDRRIVATINRLPEGHFRLPPKSGFDEVSMEGATPFKFDAHDRESLDAWYALLRTPQGEYIVAYRQENPAIAEQLLRVRQFRDQTIDVRNRVDDLSRTFAIGYGLVMLLLLLGTMWIGVVVANAIIGPVRRLAVAAGAVSEGDLTSRVDIRDQDGELGDLGRAFNDMTEQLAAQRNDLITANEQSDARRRFIEQVVAGVPAGVINVREDGRIALANPSADRILGRSRGKVTGATVDDVAPELTALLARARASKGSDVRDQLEMSRGGVTRIINARISPDDPERPRGFLVTLDDITELIAAQRNAAWGDVARRIAHEIKNPLTPIQLSAERLKRRYGKKIGDDREVFDLCTDTIIRHVGDIGRMVNEFSSFARMPEPILAKEDLREVVRSAAFSFGVANPAIDFRYQMPETEVEVVCDGRLIGQAVVNLVKNAVESITEGDCTDGELIVRVTREGGNTITDIIDNGRGLPEKDRARLTEPYMTTRVKGTGLGLAIVRKAVEEHGGQFALIDRATEGSRGAIARIILPAAKGSAASPSTDRQGEERSTVLEKEA